MENKVIILGAGIGAMTIGFENAGCRVVAAYEEDRKAIELYRGNINGDVEDLNHFFISSPESIPDTDILVCDFFRDSIFNSKGIENRNKFDDAIRIILDYKMPKIICFSIPQDYLKTNRFDYLLENIKSRGYNYKYNGISTERATGLPIAETRFYLVATHISVEDEFEFPYFNEKRVHPLDKILEEKKVDEYYYKINYNQINEVSIKDTFLCWKHNHYEESDIANTNLIKIPLVRKKKIVRKISHRELARLKSLPEDYQINLKNKAWMYKQLMYAPNIKVMTQIATNIGNVLEENALQKSYIMKGQVFSELFKKYLVQKCKNVKEEKLWDFECNLNEKDICFELKIYNSGYAIEKNIKRVCEKLALLKKDKTMILVVGNIIPKEIKDKSFDMYGIYIWDVKNLLWLFEEYSDIKNEFISLLTYSIDNLQLENPKPDLFGKQQNENERDTWEERLKAIQPGIEFFEDYENICIEILKNVLGEYLGLWSVQERSNDGLYRFDLCCKIKNGVDQDFFNTIKNYFNTKYIVFEFKNYSKQITQKEIYTTEKYLYEKALRSVAIIVSRKGANDNALSAARGCLRENGKLILCLSDKDLRELIRIKEKDEQPTAEFFEAMLDDILIHLEK